MRRRLFSLPLLPSYLGSPLLAPPAPSGGAWGDASPQTPAKHTSRELQHLVMGSSLPPPRADSPPTASPQQLYGGGLGGSISPGSPGGALDRRPQPRGQSAMGGGRGEMLKTVWPRGYN